MGAIFTVADVCKEARQVYLVDTEVGEIFTDDVLIPFVVRAFDELNSKLARIGHQIVESTMVSVRMPAGENYILTPAADMLEPLTAWERAWGSGSEDDWRMMTRERNRSWRSAQEELGGWDWHQNRFATYSSTTDRDIRISYLRFLPALTSVAIQPAVLNSKSFLSARTAALAAGHIGGNPEKAAYIQLDANDSYDDLVGIWINAEQATPVRRRPFRR